MEEGIEWLLKYKMSEETSHTAGYKMPEMDGLNSFKNMIY
jgi:hypothetical protein